jgi:putative nucleotidyltransferase with HDIG domain
MIVNWSPAHPALRTLLAAFLKQTTPVYVVGGAVRDYLLTGKTQPTDLDLVVTQAALPTAQHVANQLGWAYYPLDEARDAARLVFPNSYGAPLVCDVTSLRGGSIEADLLSRDFTVNALAFVLERVPQGQGSSKSPVQLLDVCDGQKDLANRVLRRVSATSLADDSVRLLRAVRFIYQLGFTLEAATLEQIKRAGETIRLASPERVRDELWKTLATPAPAEAIDLLRQLGLLSYVLPEVEALIGVEQSAPHHEDVYQHTLRVVKNAALIREWLKAGQVAEQADWYSTLQPWRNHLQQHFAQTTAGLHEQADWLVWFALLHDIGKPNTRSVELQADGTQRYRFFEHDAVGARLAGERLTYLRLARHEISQAQTVVAHHMRPHLLSASFVDQPISRRAAYRFFRDTSGNQLEHPVGVEIILLALADFAAIQLQAAPPLGAASSYETPIYGYGTHMQELLAFLFADERPWQQAHQQPLVDGHTLMARLKLTPGPQVGQLLEAVREAQAAGEIHTVDEAINLAHAAGVLLAAPAG